MLQWGRQPSFADAGHALRVSAIAGEMQATDTGQQSRNGVGAKMAADRPAALEEPLTT